MRICPKCKRTINATAIVDEFNDPANWMFWGEQGKRWIVCQADSFIHFRVMVDRRDHHRLAIIRERAQEWINTERDAAEHMAAINGNGSHNNYSVYAKDKTQEEWLL